MGDLLVLINSLRQSDNLIATEQDGRFNIWFMNMGDENLTIEDFGIETYYLVGYRKYVGPRYLSATIEFSIVIDEYEGPDVVYSVEGNDVELLIDGEYYESLDKEYIRYFIEGVSDTLFEPKFYYQIRISNLICDKVESSRMAFKELGREFGKRISLLDGFS